MHSRNTKSREHGAVIVEMAFALPLLALIFLNIIDLGLMIRQYQVLQNAAREGARYSAIPLNQISFSSNPSGTLLDIQNYVVQYCAQEKITISITDVTVNQTYGWPPDCRSEIVVTYTRPMLLLGAPFLPMSTLTLTGRAIFQNLYGC